MAVGLLALAVGALDGQREQATSRVVREIVLRNSAGVVVGQAPARAVRVPGEGLEFQVTMVDGQTLYINLPRANRASGGALPTRRAPSWLQSPMGFTYCSGPMKSEVVERSPRAVDVEINDDFTGPDL